MRQTVELSRREYKYVVPVAALPALRQIVAAACVPDPHAGEEGRYRLRSLYLDTPHLSLFHANEREAHHRFKVRVRGYPDAPQVPSSLELKERTGDHVRKRSVRLPPGEDLSWVDAPWRLDERDPDLAHTVSRLSLRPVVWVRYSREAYASELDAYARVTVDHQIAVCPYVRDRPPTTWHPIDHGLRLGAHTPAAVVELKFEGPAPGWMLALVRSIGLVRTGFSKYVEGVRELQTPALPRVAVGN